MKKIFTFLMAFLVVASGAVWGQDEITETKFGLTVTGPKGSFTFNSENSDLLQIQGDGVTVTNTKDDEGNIIPADCKITINCTTASEENPVTVILDNIDLRTKAENAIPIAIETGSAVTIRLKGENRVESPTQHESNHDKGILETGSNVSLTIEDAEDGMLNIINNGGRKNAIGGIKSEITIKSGLIKTNGGGIGGESCSVNIAEGVKIEMTNPEAGIYAETANIEGADISINYNSESKESGVGIWSISDNDEELTLNMSDTKFIVKDERAGRKATGIKLESGNKSGNNKVTITNCDIDMDTRKGIVATKGTNVDLSIKGNSIVDIAAMPESTIDLSEAKEPAIDISEESVVRLSSTGAARVAYGIYLGEGGTWKIGDENKNAYIVVDVVNKFAQTNGLIDRYTWKGIVFERTDGVKEVGGILNGYVYDNITMQTMNFDLKDNYHLIYCNPDKGKLTIGETGELQNNGHIFIAYDSQDQNIEEKIKGDGAYHYEVFYDESVNVPEELKGNLKDAILSDDLIRKMSHPNADERTEMIFGESEKAITLSIDEEKYPGYTFTFKAKTEKDGNEIEVNGNSFKMPAEAVRIYDIRIEKKYIATVSDEIDNTQGGVTIAIGEETTNRAEFAENDEVNLIVSKEPGYVLDRLYYKNEEGIEVEIDDVMFLMPASDVTIYATFKPESQGGDDEGDDDSTSGAYKKRFRLYLANEDYFPKDCEEDYEQEGLVLFSRHDKKYTHAGGSFTIWYEQFGEPNVGNYRVFWSKTAKGEYKEVKFDEVSEYFQIRDVHSNVFVKLYYETGFPVSNETIEATEARAYAQPNKIVVITPEPTDVQIISMAGAVVASAQVAGQQEFANLAEGVYIVRMGKEIIKLQVRN